MPVNITYDNIHSVSCSNNVKDESQQKRAYVNQQLKQAQATTPWLKKTDHYDFWHNFIKTSQKISWSYAY